MRVPERTRERILVAAYESFAHHGYRRATVDDIAVAAGVGKGTVYLHFQDKDALFLAVMARKALELNDAARVGMADEPDTVARLSRMLRAVVARLNEDPLLRRLIAGDPEVRPPHLRSVLTGLHREAMSLMEETLRLGVEAKDIIPINPRVGAFVLFNLYETYYFGDLPKEEMPPEDEFIEFVEHMVRRGLVRGD